jgi:hypothetical protein
MIAGTMKKRRSTKYVMASLLRQFTIWTGVPFWRVRILGVTMGRSG